MKSSVSHHIRVVAASLLLVACAARATDVTFIPAGKPLSPTGTPGWSYKLGTTEGSTPVTAWRTNTFVEDGTWTGGATPIGYTTGANDPLGYEAALTSPQLPTSANGNYLSVFLRKKFVVTNAANVSSVSLAVVADDGYVAWLNGRELTRYQCCNSDVFAGVDTATPAYNANANNSVTSESALTTTLTANNATGPLVEGTNVLCIMLFNVNSTSSDLVLDAELKGTVDDTAPVVTSVNPDRGSAVRTLTQVEVIFSETVTNVDASDLLVNGVAATGLNSGGPNQFVFSFPEPATGKVTFAFAPGHGITDLAPVPNAFAGDTWTNILDPNLAFLDVRINEFMADNENGIRDEDGTHQDWIELYNAGSGTVSLDGWYLTDSATNLRKWRFPAGVQMQPGGYLLVWASGKDRTNNVAALHTNFKLAKSGGYLGLVLPDGTNVVSAFAPTYPAQTTDASYGRDRLDPNIVGFYDTPTPGSANTVGGSRAGFAPDVTFSLSSSTFVNPFNLTLSTTSTNAVIRYVLITNAAGAAASITNIPTTNSPIYTGAIPVTVTTEVRARAFQTGVFPGAPRTENYIQVNNDVKNFSSDIPVVIVHALGNGSIPQVSPNLSSIFMAFDNEGRRSSVTNQPQVATRMGMHVRGSSTLGQAKSNLRIEFWDDFNQDIDLPLLGMPADSDWVLYGINGFDPGLMHNAIYQWLGKQVGVFNMRTRYVEVFRKVDSGPVTTNDYFGLYILMETPKVGDKRTDIAKLHDQDTNSTAITGGYIFKIDRVDNERSFTPPQIGTIRPTPAPIVFTDPPYKNTETDSRRLAQINYFQNYVLNFLTNLSNPGYTNPVTGYAKYINPDQWVNHLIANIIPYNADGYRLSGFMYKDRLGRLEQGPMWDCDRCMGTGGTSAPQTDNRNFAPRYWRLPANDVNTDNGTDFFGVSNVGVSWFTRLFSDPDFWQRFIDRYQATRTNEFSSNSIVAKIDGLYTEIKEAQVREQNRWGGTWQGALQSFTYPRSGVQTVNGYTFDFGPADNNGRGRFTNEVNFQKRWLLDRLDFIDTNFLSMPTLSTGSALVTNGTTVTAVAASKSGSILLYTLDGTDPRLPGGGISPTAKTNVGVLTLTISNNVRLFARSYNPNHFNLTNNTAANEVGKPLINSFWSGPVAATYYTVVPSLSITEIMFHPENPPAGNTNDPDNYEYIELKNTGTNVLSLIGVRFTNGIDFTFTATNAITSLAPGEYVLIVKSISAFTNRYGTALLSRVGGEFGGNLDNGGERLTLVGSMLEPILDFEYKDSWYDLADGSGFSLVLADENTPASNYGTNTSWRISNAENGSPGVVDPGPRFLPQIVISEALTHTDPPQLDTIELQNLAATNVDVSGWFLTDNFDAPKKYVIPAGTIIPPGGFVTFVETNVSNTGFNQGINKFALSSEGDNVYVFSGDGVNLTGWAHGFDFGAAQNGVTFIRYVDSQTNEHFVASAANTLGASNSLPRVGPIVISEIHYHPPEIPDGTNFLDNAMDEFVELHNISGAPVPLFDTNNNTWKLSKGVDFLFPTNITVPSNGYVILVNFTPGTNAGTDAAFRGRFGLSGAVPLFGPLGGKLDNSGEKVKLSRPDAPNPTTHFVPYIEVDRVAYRDSEPWPAAADGFGASMQRIVETAFGNDPTNWAAAYPSAGAVFTASNPPAITQQPASGFIVEGTSTNLVVAATGIAPLRYQWRFNGTAMGGATNSTFPISNATTAMSGDYSVAVFSGDGAVSTSSNATILVKPLPKITVQPISQTGPPGTNVTMTVAATGNPPFRYQWRLYGTNVEGATNASYAITNAQLSHAGNYDCVVTDSVGSVTSQTATLIILVKPFIITAPQPTTVVQGGTAYFSVVAGPSHPTLPLSYRWILVGAPGTTTNLLTNFVYVLNCQVSGQLRLQVTSPAGQTNVTSGITLTVLPDANGDGVPDDAQTYLRLGQPVVVNGTNVLLQFNAASNRVYQVHSRAALNPAAPWSNIFSLSAAPSNRVITVTNNVAGVGLRFYRLVNP